MNGQVKLSVKSFVNPNRSKLETDADVLEDVQTSIDINGIFEDAWCDLCLQQELECLECKEEFQQQQVLQHHLYEDSDNNPDLATTGQLHFLLKNNTMCRREGLH